jgi:disulfide bond formation protein DsbB
MLFLAGLVLLIMTGFNPRYACIAFVTIAFIILGVAISITAKPHWMAHRKRPYNVYEHVDCDLWAEDLYEDFKEDWH